MKKRLCAALLLLLAFLFPVSALAENAAQAEKAPQEEKVSKAEKAPQPILYTYYRQIGWGDRVQIAYVDSKGGLWLLKGYDSELQWPARSAEQILYLSSHEFEKKGTLKFDDLFALKSLVAVVEPSDAPSVPAACDAGIERTLAVRYDREGKAETVLLGMSGDDMFENLDPNAQGLYLAAHRLFPEVTCYGGLMGPAGFTPVRIAEFCGLEDLSLQDSVRSWYIDCEAGPREVTLTPEEQTKVLSAVLNGMVTGKVSAIQTTGGYREYAFYRGDRALGGISICGGLLYCSDGMYSIG